MRFGNPNELAATTADPNAASSAADNTSAVSWHLMQSNDSCFLASLNLLADSSIRPLCIVQHAGKFVVTFLHGHHAGLNLGFNCTEAVNFATERWVEIGLRARVCQCIKNSVRIDVEEKVKAREEGRTAELVLGNRMGGGRMMAMGRMMNKVKPGKRTKDREEEEGGDENANVALK